MKRVLFCIVPLIVFVSCVSIAKTDPALLDKPFEYIYEYSDLNKEELFKRAKLWFAETYNSAESVLSFEDRESGVLKGNAIASGMMAGDIYVRSYKYNISIQVKDNKAKLEFLNVGPHQTYSGTTQVGGINIDYQAGYDVAKENFDNLAASFDRQLKEGIDSDW